MNLLSFFQRWRKPAKTRILAVDDDPNVRELVRGLLESEGYAVDTAVDGLEGLALVKKNSYDLLVLDGRLPKMSGTELLEMIRSTPEGQTQAVIMLSAEDMLGPIYKAYEMGIIEWVSKPFSPEKFLAKVHAHLDAVKK
jgi:DNA-binding response OmpR family regulator